jgi:hypothetical protein
MFYYKKMVSGIHDYNNISLLEWVCKTFTTMDSIYPHFNDDMYEVRRAKLMNMVSYFGGRFMVSSDIESVMGFMKRLFTYQIPKDYKLKQQLIVFRRAELSDVPNKILFPIFTSTSLSHRFTKGWRQSLGCCMYRIKVNPNINYFPAYDMCHEAFQYEIVLPPGELIYENTQNIEGITYITGTYTAWTRDYWQNFISKAPRMQ